MNKPHVHADLIYEWARTGKKVQVKYNGEWVNALTPAWDPKLQYRFKPEVKRYRVALFEDGPMAATTEDIEDCNKFIRWLTDWVEYEV